jgi:hypothetical protein
MNPARAGANVLAILAILLLLGLGFVAYAVPGSAGSGPSTGGASGGPKESEAGSGPDNGLSYALLPTPAYLHQQVPDNYSFKEGGALIVASGDTLQVRTSFLGSPRTGFTTVLQTGDQNLTLGSVTTGGSGGAAFRGNVTLQPGSYDVGLLVFVSGQMASPVGVSVPRDIHVTLRGASQTSSTTTTTSTTPSQQPQATDELEFTPISVQGAPKSYSYGEGGGGYSVEGGNVFFSLRFTGQNPSTQYSLVLSVNGSARTIAQYTTNHEGGGGVAANASLGSGRFVLGLTVVDSSTFASPTPVLASSPSSFTVELYGSVTTPPSGNSSSIAPPTSSGLAWTFKLVPATNSNGPEGYRFAKTGTAVVSLDARDSLLNVELGFQDANPSTTYEASLVLNGTGTDLGSMTTNREGGAVLHASIQVSPGRYLMGIAVYDVSDVAAFEAAAPVLVLVSDPSAQLAVIVPPTAVEYSSTSTTSSSESQGTTSSTENIVTKAATTISAGTQIQAQIQSEVGNLTIPATVQVTPLSSSTTVLDPRFSLSVGQQVGNGLVIAISGENVTGPRVLLVNMSKTSPLSLFPALNVTLDGSPVAEASSAVQVLNPVSGNPPLYVLVATSNSIQLLVSIPHFSLHLIQVAGVVVRTIVTSLELDAPLLAGSILVITLAFVGAYVSRKRYFSILI